MNASYSCGNPDFSGYAYKIPLGYKLSDGTTLPKGTKVVLFAKVLIGQEQFLENEDKGRKDTDEGFDSVKASTNGSDVYVIYSGANKRTYPMFLVYFK